MKEIENRTQFEEIINQDKPVLIDFYADWCGPCQMLMPTLNDLSEKHVDDFVIAKVNVDRNQELAQNFNIRSIPSLFFFKDGLLVEKIHGAQPADTIEKKLSLMKAA